jgi:hypothetical protein
MPRYSRQRSEKEGKTSHENGPREENDVRDDVYLLTKPFTIAFYWLFVMVQRQIFTNNNVESRGRKFNVPFRSCSGLFMLVRWFTAVYRFALRFATLFFVPAQKYKKKRRAGKTLSGAVL